MNKNNNSSHSVAPNLVCSEKNQKKRVLLTDLVAQILVVSPRGTAENTTSGALQRGATTELELNSATKPVFDDPLSLSGGTIEARASRVARGRKDNLCDV